MNRTVGTLLVAGLLLVVGCKSANYRGLESLAEGPQMPDTYAIGARDVVTINYRLNPELNQRLVIGHELQDQVAVQRLGETRVGHSGRYAARLERLAGLHHLAQTRAEGQDRNAAAFADHPATPDFQNLAALGHGHARAFATRIAERDRPLVMRGGRGDHMLQFSLIRSGHHQKLSKEGTTSYKKPSNRAGSRVLLPACRVKV